MKAVVRYVFPLSLAWFTSHITPFKVHCHQPSLSLARSTGPMTQSSGEVILGFMKSEDL